MGTPIAAYRGFTPSPDACAGRLAAEGVSCTDAYVTAPICSPSRAAIISGRYQQRWGGQWFDSAAFPPDDVPTLAEILRDQGYRTGYFGKVHYGGEAVGDRACPPHHGFEETLYGLAVSRSGGSTICITRRTRSRRTGSRRRITWRSSRCCQGTSRLSTRAS